MRSHCGHSPTPSTRTSGRPTSSAHMRVPSVSKQGLPRLDDVEDRRQSQSPCAAPGIPQANVTTSSHPHIRSAINPDAVDKLTFPWSDGRTFSFDLGGVLRGADIHGQEFLAEIKNYSAASDQGNLYTEYLAKCYRAFQEMPARCDHFMWLTRHP